MYTIYTFNKKTKMIAIKRNNLNMTHSEACALRDKLRGAGNDIIFWTVVSANRKEEYFDMIERIFKVEVRIKNNHTTYNRKGEDVAEIEKKKSIENFFNELDKMGLRK